MTETTKTTNGWHRVIIEGHRADTGSHVEVAVRWRTQPRTCHGNDIGFAAEIPVYIDSSDGRVRGWVRQCGSCGTLNSPEWYVLGRRDLNPGITLPETFAEAIGWQS